MVNGNFLPEIGQELAAGSLGRWIGLIPFVPSGEDVHLRRKGVDASGGCPTDLSESVVRWWGRGTFGEHKVNGRCHMSKQRMTGAPVCTWVAVTDASGRTRMEARWSTAEAVATQAA